MSHSYQPLYRFFLDRFTDSELRGLFMFNYPELVDALPGRALSFAELAMAVVSNLQRNGAIDDRLFALLERERPRLRGEIERLRQQLAAPDGDSTVEAPRAKGPSRGGSVPGTAVTKQLRVVFAAANPMALEALQLSTEAKRIEDKLRGTPGEHRITFDWFWKAGPESLIDLLFTNPDVLHFAGHGADNGALLLETSEGQSHPVPPEAFAELIAARPRRPRMIVLNACHSAVMARELAPLVDVVVGMRGAVEDGAARRFAVELYRAIAHGDAIKTAFDTARAALRVFNLSNDDMPQLSVRGGLDARAYHLL